MADEMDPMDDAEEEGRTNEEDIVDSADDEEFEDVDEKTKLKTRTKIWKPDTRACKVSSRHLRRRPYFDVDRTLGDSNHAHAEAWGKAAAERGRCVNFSRIRPLIGIIALRSGGSTDEPPGKALAIDDDRADLLNPYDLSPFNRPLPARSA